MGNVDTIIKRAGCYFQIFAGAVSRKDGRFSPQFMVGCHGAQPEGIPFHWKPSDVAFDSIQEAGDHGLEEGRKWVDANYPPP